MYFLLITKHILLINHKCVYLYQYKSYIPEDILKYIKEFKFEDTGVKVPQQADREVIVAGNTIQSPLEWKQLQVFGMDGKCYYHSAKYQPTVKLPISLNGVYIMRILLSDNNKIVKKIKL